MLGYQMRIANPFRACAMLFVVFLISGSALQADVVLISETFSGTSTDPLHGTTADVFSSSITAAGGSSTWAARSGAMQFNADGSITTSSTADGIAFLDLGTFIEDAKGTTDGIFELSMTLGEVTNGNWVAFGFSTELPASLTHQFFIPDPDLGVATVLRNNTPEEFFYLPGRGLDNGIGSTPVASDDHRATIRLDVSTYDGVSDFGNVSFFLDGESQGGFSYTEENTFRTIMISQDNGGIARVSQLTLVGVPEPSAGMVLFLTGVFVCLRRSNRKVFHQEFRETA